MHLPYIDIRLPTIANLPHHMSGEAGKGEGSGVAKKLDEPIYIAPARLSFYSLFMVTPYLYSVPMFIMPGRIFSTLSFCIYPVVYSNGEFKKYFATPLRSPLQAYSG